MFQTHLFRSFFVLSVLMFSLSFCGSVFTMDIDTTDIEGTDWIVTGR